MNYAAQLAMVLPEEVLSVGALLLMLVAAWGGQASTRAVSWCAVAVLAGATVALLGPASSGGEAFAGLYRVDAFSAFAKLLIFVGSAVAIVIAPHFFERTVGDDLRPEYPVLILLSAVGMAMMVSAADLLTLYVGLELQSLAAYVLASFMRRDTRSAEAGLKYFVLGALASGILLYGISLVYGFTGSTLFGDVAQAYAGGHSLGLMFGLVFVFAGLAFKLAAVPFHMWTPDVYEGAPTPVTAFFASAPKVAAMALAVRVAIVAMGPALGEWRQIVIFASLASIVLGAVGAIGQTNVKRLLAYSSINNVGFTLVGLAAGTPEGVASVLFYLTIYIAMTLGSFIVVLQMRDAAGQPVESIASLSGLSRTRPGLALAMAIFMFSLAGIPPLLGFNAKLAVFSAAVDAGLYPLAVIGFVASVIGAYYYLRVVKVMYIDEPAPAFQRGGSIVEGGLIAAAATFVSPVGWVPARAARPVDGDRGQGAVLTPTIRSVAETGSTNADLLQLARTGADEGLWMRADLQTAGRGRQGRAWSSPVGNLYASTLVRLHDREPPAATLALVAAVALEESVGLLIAGLTLKWPNDLLLGGAKLSGILLERADDAVVIGFGVNLAHHPTVPDRPTTSLAAHGVIVRPADFVAALADMFAAWLHIWRSDGLAPVRNRWVERAHPAGTPLSARLPDGNAIDGRFDGLAEDGALRLRLADGATRVIHAADVFLI